MNSVSHLLKTGWSLVEGHRSEFARYVFARLFLLDPAARDRFPIALEVQYTQLLSAVVGTITQYDDADALEDHLQTLRRQHRRYRLTGRQLEILGSAVLAGVREFAGPGWGTEYDRAWSAAYQQVRTVAAAGDPEPDSPASRGAEVLAHRRLGTDRAELTVAPFSPLAYRPASTSRWRARTIRGCGGTSASPTPRARTTRWTCRSGRSAVGWSPAPWSAVPRSVTGCGWPNRPAR